MPTGFALCRDRKFMRVDRKMRRGCAERTVFYAGQSDIYLTTSVGKKQVFICHKAYRSLWAQRSGEYDRQ